MRPGRMKTKTTKARASGNGKARRNGRIPSRQELLTIHERALKELDNMTAKEGFETLVEVGIYTPKGKLTPRYGG